MKLFPLHVANHPIYDLQHLRNILFDSAKDDICIYLKIVSKALRIFCRLSNSISESNINTLLLYSLLKQLVHIIAHAHQIY